MFLQVDALGADAAAALARAGRRDRRDRRPTRADGLPALEVESETGRDVRRELAAAVVEPRLGPAGAAADAHEPGGRVPDADDAAKPTRRPTRRRRRPTAATEAA